MARSVESRIFTTYREDQVLLVVPNNEALALALARTLSLWHETTTAGLPALTGAPWRADVGHLRDHLRLRGGSVLVATVPLPECGIIAEERAAELTLTARVGVQDNLPVGLCLAREHRELEAGLVAAGIKIIRVGKEILLSTLAHLRTEPSVRSHRSAAEQKLLAMAEYRVRIGVHMLVPNKEFDLLMQRLAADLSMGQAERSVLVAATAAWATVTGWVHGALDCLAASEREQEPAVKDIEPCQAKLDEWLSSAATGDPLLDPREGVEIVSRLRLILERAQSLMGEAN